MDRTPSNPKPLDTNRVSHDLGLRFDPLEQDWGSVNADWERLEEFLNYYRRLPSEVPIWVKRDLAELLFASVHQAPTAAEVPAEAFARFVEDYREDSAIASEATFYLTRVPRREVPDWLFKTIDRLFRDHT